MSKKEMITVQGTGITVINSKESDYISLTDMAGYKDELEARVVVSNWMSTRFTLEFWGIWEQSSVCIFSKSGRYGGGIFAHKDIAFEFGSWLSAEFKLYLIKNLKQLR
ncbi:MAG: KilA-N domain-containing protein [Tannerella sp.]|jgi:hypothetical protein|nr:KilA-N domain-containing protein [Tannerella sp.]